MGVVSNTPADILDEVAEHSKDRWIAIYISVLAVLLAIGATGSNDAMKMAQQAGFGSVDTYAFYQAKTIRQGSYKLAAEALDMRRADTTGFEALPESARKLIEAKQTEYLAETKRLESDGERGKKELLAKAEDCDNERKLALASHPFYDYSQAMLQIAIVLASASIITGTRLLIAASGLVGILAVLFLVNGYTLLYGSPALKFDRTNDLVKSGVTKPMKCLES